MHETYETPARRSTLLMLLVVLLVAGCDTNVPGEEERPERLAGGALTVFETGRQAFATPAPVLTGERLVRHQEGDANFDQQFVTAPAEAFGGLGPAFNDRSCLACHFRSGRTEGALLLQASGSGTDPNGGPAPLDDFGLQIQDHAIVGMTPEAQIAIDYEEQSGQFADGTPYTLRDPTYRLESTYAQPPADMKLTPRTPRPVFGLGLLEAVPAQAIRALAQRQAQNGEVSGEPNRVWSLAEGRMMLGRFGWKAENPTVRQQTAGAFQRDMGLTSPLLPDESTHGQGGYDDGLDDDPELSAETVSAVAFYIQTLGVPARRGLDDPAVQRGSDLFEQIGCTSCHVRRLETGSPPNTPPETHDQAIYPYTDLLLHDMGEGLADGRESFEASGREWRTPPLWGIGLSGVVSGNTEFLHDGRARNLTEAILWHGGEAASAREQFRQLSQEERDDLTAFLHSL